MSICHCSPGDDLILKRMKRRHTRQQAIDMVARLKEVRPETAIGADIIAGFPTETDEMFRNSVDIVDTCDIVHGHIFPYSPREGTPAARMPQVDGAVIKQRAKILRDRIAEKKRQFQADLCGTVQNVLAERGGKAGYSENFAHIAFDKPVPEGEIIAVKVRSGKDDKLIGKPL